MIFDQPADLAFAVVQPRRRLSQRQESAFAGNLCHVPTFFGYSDSNCLRRLLDKELLPRSLPARWTLGDVDDVEKLVRKALGATTLNPDEAEDAIAYLFEVVWRTWRRWDPERGSFSTIAYQACRSGFVDWKRKRYGRTRWTFGDGQIHERPLPQFVSLDNEALERDRVELALGEGTSNDPADCSPDLDRLLRNGGCSRARDIEALGLHPPRRAT
jgi:sigma-70-like protein